jgi:hypothetical protein
VSLSDELDISQTLRFIPSFSDEPAQIRTRKFASADVLGLTSFGVRFDLSANDVDLLRDALLHLPVGCKRSFSCSVSPQYSLVRHDHLTRRAESAYQLYRNGRLLCRCGDRREFLERFSSIIALYVAEASRRRTFVRAGAVGWGGSAILIPGRSCSGKTTLVAELVRAGATYYSDEFAVLDKGGIVYPYACPLQIKTNGSACQTRRSIEEFGGIAGQEPLPVGLVIVSTYKPEAKWRPRPVSPEVGLSKLLDNTASAKRSPTTALDTLTRVLSDAVIVRGVRGEACQVVDWITAHFTSHEVGAHFESPQRFQNRSSF